MEEAVQSLESKEDRLANDSDPPDGAVRKVFTEMKNGDGNMREEVKNYGDEKHSSEEFKTVVEAKNVGDLKDGEDQRNLKEVKDREETNSISQIKNGEEDKDVGETKVVVEMDARKAVDGEEKEAGDSQDMEEKKNLEKTKDEEEKKVAEVQNGNGMKFAVEGKDGEVNRVLERVDDAGDKKSVEALEDIKYNNEKYGLGVVEAIQGKSEEEGSSPIDDKSVEELKNGKDEEGVEEMKDDEHSKTVIVEKDEESILVQVEDDDEGKAGKEAKDVEMVGAEDVVVKEAADVKDEGKLVVREGEEEKEDNGGNADKTVGDNQKAESLKRKRGGRRPSETGEAKKKGDTKENVEETEVKGSGKRLKEVLSTPAVSSSERPMRERKTVERLVEVIEKGPDRTVIIETGRGTPLKKIPNVAYKLARKKPAELKFLHQTLFGRKGKAVDFKSNLLQFCGFAWHESEEKQRAKIKEKLDKCVKETLLDLCDLFDLTVSKTNTKKDDIIVKVLDFMEAPQATNDVIHAEEQSSKSQKRKRAPKVNASKSSGGTFEKRSRQKHDKTQGTPNSEVKSSHDTEDDEEDEDSEEHYDYKTQKEDEVRNHSESDAEEKELEETGGDEEDESEDDTDLRKEKQEVKKSPKLKEKQDVKKSPKRKTEEKELEETGGDEEDESEDDADLRKEKQEVKKSPKLKEKQDVKKSPKKEASSDTVKRKTGSNSKKTSPKTVGKSSLKTPPSKHPKVEKNNDTGEKVFSRKKKDAQLPKKSNSKEKSSGKASKSKTKSGKEQKSGPRKAELRKSICEILKEVDFNTATFTDILKQLEAHYKIDLTSRKAAIKLMIQEELTKMADEADSQDGEEMQ